MFDCLKDWLCRIVKPLLSYRREKICEGRAMLLNRDQIRDFIQDAKADCFQAASYNPVIGKIIAPSGKILESYDLPPQGMVKVISRERIKLPRNVAGNASIKTSLCDEGILTLNIGIIDPTYDGLLSSTVINFGRNPYHLKVNDVFLRLTFHQYDPPAQLTVLPRKSDEEYLKEKKIQVLEHFSELFLNMSVVSRRAAAEVFGSWRKGLLTFVPVAAVVIALITFGVTVGVSYVDRRWPARDRLRDEVVDELRATALKALEEQTANHRALEEQIRQLQQQMQQVSASPQRGASQRQ